MKFGEAWELIRKGKKLRRKNWKGYWYLHDNGVYIYDEKGERHYPLCAVLCSDDIIRNMVADDWILVKEPKKFEKPQKVFISQPMAGKTQKQIITERIKAVEEIQRILGNVEIIDTMLELGEDALPLEYLAESIKLLAKADVIFLMEGWQNARGCRIEHECAESYGIAIIMQ